jgi:NADH-quinone oxidoreductase subunit I
MFNFFEKAYTKAQQAFSGLYQIGRGLDTVLMHSWREPTTEQYPDKTPNLPPHFRGRLALTVNPETNENLCISCRQCERVCPDKCIEITAHKSPETNKLELIDFKIDHGLCMFCGLCTEVCPTLCIINTNDFEMADYTRESLIYDLKKLTLTQEESAYYFEKQEMPLPKPKPVKAAAAAKPAATGAGPAASEQASEPKPAAIKSETAVKIPDPSTNAEAITKPANSTEKTEKAMDTKPASEPEKPTDGDNDKPTG